MPLTLVATGHPTDTLFSGRYDMSGDAMTIGRASDNHWVVDDQKRMVSKRHCKIERVGEGYRLSDTSTNGVTVNGRPVDKASGTLLKHGDEIELGQYRFSVEIPVAEEVTQKGDHILGDITPEPFDEALAGEHRDAFEGLEERRRDTPSAIPSMGWDGPPQMDDDIIKPADIIDAMDHEARNRSEQIPTDRIVIDLPDPGEWRDEAEDKGGPVAPDVPPAASADQAEPEPAITPEPPAADRAGDAGDSKIPTNWWMHEGAGASAPASQPSTTAPADRPAPVSAAPVADIEPDVAEPAHPTPEQAIPPAAAVRAPVPDMSAEPAIPPVAASPADPAPRQATPSSAAVLTALAEGMGVDPSSLAGADPDRLLRNIGKALAISVRQLQSLQMTTNKAASVLETDQDQLGYTPWIFSLAGGDRSGVVASIANFLGEAEERDLDAMKRDFEEIEQFVNAATSGTIALVDELQKTLDPAVLEKQVSGAANMLPQLRKAALWDALVKQSNLFDGGKQGSSETVMESLIAKIAAARRDSGGR